MPEHCVEHFDKLLVKSKDFCKKLTILTEDLKIEEVSKDTKVIKSDIFQGSMCYNPVKSAGLFCNGGGFLSVKDAFSETGYPAFYR